MSGWEVLTIIAVPAWGGLIFLRLVADAVLAAKEGLVAFKKREQRVLRRQQEAEMRMAAVA